jgi:hypothetical protein
MSVRLINLDLMWDRDLLHDLFPLKRTFFPSCFGFACSVNKKMFSLITLISTSIIFISLHRPWLPEMEKK